MREHKGTGKVKLVSLTVLVVPPGCQLLHKHYGNEEINSKVNNSSAL